MKSVICGLILALSLTGCALASFEKDARKLTAPDVIVYADAQLEAAADETEGGACPVLTEFAKDYCVMRDQARVLRGEKKRCTLKR